MPTRYGPSVKSIRKKLGFTQAEFAAELGVAQSVISRWERNRIRPSLPSLQAYRKFALNAGLPWNDSWLTEGP